jgi:aminopeptidase YwaD
MTDPSLKIKAENYLKYLCLDLPTRRVGSQGNRDANEFLAEKFASFGFKLERQPFDCIDWTQGAATLCLNGEQFQVHVGPFTVGCYARAPLVVASSLEELESIDARDTILLLRGELTREQLMPKNFPFYNPDEHKRIISLLETKKPRAVLTATGRNPESSGAVYPFPLIEDGDFDIPSAYMTEEEGARLASHATSWLPSLSRPNAALRAGSTWLPTEAALSGGWFSAPTSTPKTIRPARWIMRRVWSCCSCWLNC